MPIANPINAMKKFFKKGEAKGLSSFNIPDPRHKGASFRTEAEQAKAAESVAWIGICAGVIVEEVGNRPYRFEDIKGKVIDESLVDERILLPIKNGLLPQQFTDMVGTAAGQRALTGEALWVRAQGTAYGKLKNLQDRFFPIDPGCFSIKTNHANTVVEGYYVDFGDGIKKIVSPEDVIHFYDASLIDRFSASGIVDKLKLIAECEANSDIFNSQFMASKATPHLLVSDEAEGITDESAKEIRASLERNYSGPYGKKIMYVNGKGIKVDTLQLPHKDIQWLETKQFNKKTILAAFGIVPEAVGDIEFSNLNVSKTMMLRHRENMNARIRKMENTINDQHVHRFNPNIFIRFEKYFTGDVDNLVKMVNNGMITPLESSQLLGVPVENVPKGDPRRRFYMSGNLVELGANSIENEVGKPNTQKEEKSHDGCDLMDPSNFKEICSEFVKSATIPKMFQVEYLRESLKSRKEIVEKNTQRISGFFVKEGLRIKEKFLEMHEPKALSDEDAERIAAELVEEGQKEFASLMLGIHTSGVVRAIADVNNITDSSVNPNTTNPFVKAALKDLGSKITRINDTTREAVAKIIDDSVSSGLSVREIGDLLEDKFNDFSGYRARMIARTEARAAYDAGSKVAYTELGVKTVDVVGCIGLSVHAGGHEPTGDCGKQNLPIHHALNFHPNHIGVVVPSKNPRNGR